MNLPEMERLMHQYDIADNALLFHSYKQYMRDYELIVGVYVGPAEEGVYSYLFKYCVESHVVTAVSSANYKKSLDERLIDLDSGKDLNGFVWGANWSTLSPGWTLNTSSKDVISWQERIGLEFHEMEIGTEAYSIKLIFSSIEVKRISDDSNPSVLTFYLP